MLCIIMTGYIKSGRVNQPAAWCGTCALTLATVIAIVVQAFSFLLFALSDINHHKIG